MKNIFNGVDGFDMIIMGVLMIIIWRDLTDPPSRKRENHLHIFYFLISWEGLF